jgi:hypothetical protein
MIGMNKKFICHPEPPKDTKCRRTVEGSPDSLRGFQAHAQEILRPSSAADAWRGQAQRNLRRLRRLRMTVLYLPA